MSRFFFYTSFFLIFIGCQTKTESTQNINEPVIVKDSVADIEIKLKQSSVIDKPFDEINLNFRTYNYSNSLGTIINLASGTEIIIPANAFEDSLGNPITKNIEIKYREFHNITDIMLSGIKMAYNEDDKTGDFESAGMFEIRAFQKKKNLFLRKNKNINIELASFKTGEFNSYGMNKESTNWNFIEKSKSILNKRKKKKLEELDKEKANLNIVCNISPREYQPGDEIFDRVTPLNRKT